MQSESVSSCPVCSTANFQHALTCEDHTLTHEQFDLQKCVGCGLLLTNPRPDNNSIGSYYDSADYISHTNNARNVFDIIYLTARSLSLKWKHRLITKIKTGTTLLDYGCGTGQFLNYMHKNNWNASGVEPSTIARQNANQVVGVQHIFNNLKEVPTKNFDIITLWHVLEHVAQPGELLNDLKNRLKADGLIFVAVPNHESFDAKYYQQFWAGYDVPRHFWHFTKSSMEQLLIKHGLAVKEIIPMKLDAFYVSLLSEKYKNNGHSLLTPIKAVITGLRSNSRAKKNLNYSSLIYIAGHA